jgi:hypothetical protein
MRTGRRSVVRGSEFGEKDVAVIPFGILLEHLSHTQVLLVLFRTGGLSAILFLAFGHGDQIEFERIGIGLEYQRCYSATEVVDSLPLFLAVGKKAVEHTRFQVESGNGSEIHEVSSCSG